jgi:PhnB protein
MSRDPRIPANYNTVMPYLILENAIQFSGFVQRVFGAKELEKQMGDGLKVRHAEIMIGDSTIMFADATEQYKAIPASLFVYVDNADVTFSRALEAGAGIVNEVTDQSYGRSGGVMDRFGNTWWITQLK